MIANNSCGCGTVCPPPAPTCVTPAPVCPPTSEVTTLNDILALIATKGSAELSSSNQAAIASLVAEVKTLQEQVGDGEESIDHSKYQLISNMINELDGDLDGKYPSAALLKEGLISLWQCVNTKNKHYGLWSENTVMQNITPDAGCLIVDNDVPPTQKVQVPIGIGDTVIGADGCIYESLQENNTCEPTVESVYEGAYRSNCLEREILDRVTALEAALVPEVGKLYLKTLNYEDNDTSGDISYFDTVPEGKYLGHIQIWRLAETENQMDDTYVYMRSNGGTTVSGHRTVVGEVSPITELDRASASGVFTVSSNGTDPVKIELICDGTGSRFRGYVYCTLIRIG